MGRFPVLIGTEFFFPLASTWIAVMHDIWAYEGILMFGEGCRAKGLTAAFVFWFLYACPTKTRSSTRLQYHNCIRLGVCPNEFEQREKACKDNVATWYRIWSLGYLLWHGIILPVLCIRQVVRFCPKFGMTQILTVWCSICLVHC